MCIDVNKKLRSKSAFVVFYFGCLSDKMIVRSHDYE